MIATVLTGNPVGSVAVRLGNAILTYRDFRDEENETKLINRNFYVDIYPS